MIDIFLQQNPGRMNLDVFIASMDSQTYQNVKPFKLELSEPRPRDEPSYMPEPTISASPHDLISIHRSLGEQLQKFGLIKPHPSEELLKEKDIMIDKLDKLLRESIKFQRE